MTGDQPNGMASRSSRQRRNYNDMKLGRIALILAAVLMLAATASASTIQFGTSAAETGFTAGGLTLDSNGGTANATLTFNPVANGTSAGYGFISYGFFQLVCSDCSSQASQGADATFGSFTFDLVVTDSSDGAVEEFVGTSSGGTVWSDASQVSIDWTPTQMGPGPATGPGSSGDFGSTVFTISTPTPIVAPTTLLGETSVQGTLNSTNAPEPATMALAGSLLLGLGGLARKRRK